MADHKHVKSSGRLTRVLPNLLYHWQRFIDSSMFEICTACNAGSFFLRLMQQPLRGCFCNKIISNITIYYTRARLFTTRFW